jgi:hypothetical protein
VKGWSPENDHNPEADTVIDDGRQHSRAANGEVATTLAGSKTAAWDQEDELGTWEAQGVGLKVWAREQQAMKGKELLKTLWESDQLTVPTKQGNACRGKELAVVRESEGKHSPHAEAGERVETRLGILTEKARGNPKMRFTSLAHILNEEFLKGCFEEMKRKKASANPP